jgi:hypothetical protein
VWAVVLDEWAKTGIAANEIPVWIAATRGGIRGIYEAAAAHKDAISGGVVYPPAGTDNVYTGDVLAQRIVKYLPDRAD